MMNNNSLGHALVQWVYRAPSGRLVRIRQWQPDDPTPKAILCRQHAGLPYEKLCLVNVNAKGAEYADLQPRADDDHAVEYHARLAQQHVDLISRSQ